ncbi:MAG: hypothetical protein J7L95_07130 [Prolixibacteraceae bacterium]|nr:hypothetical protein [Prolixibacteraceae bacterium]
MKTRINQFLLSVFFALLILGGNVKAEGTEVAVSSHENIKEESLELEDWMLDEAFWNISETTLRATQSSEKSLELESWMTDEKRWEFNNINFETEKEQELNLEFWMINGFGWDK